MRHVLCQVIICSHMRQLKLQDAGVTQQGALAMHTLPPERGLGANAVPSRHQIRLCCLQGITLRVPHAVPQCMPVWSDVDVVLSSVVAQSCLRHSSDR